jgi:hypothetical protein
MLNTKLVPLSPNAPLPLGLAPGSESESPQPNIKSITSILEDIILNNFILILFSYNITKKLI